LKEKHQKGHGKIATPAVLGSVIDMGYCFNLMEAGSIQLISTGYELLYKSVEATGGEMPKNSVRSEDGDLLLRNLGCAVIQLLHELRKRQGERPFDSVRSLFLEGAELYPNAGFRKKNHIQICVITPNCFKGFFIPRPYDSHYHRP
jgi:hypothetical protein